MSRARPAIGAALAFVCLGILGVMPIISNSRPPGFEALSFAFFLSIWQLACAVPLMVHSGVPTPKGIFSANLPPALRRRTIGIILLTGTIFGLSTFVYVLAMERAGAVSAAIAIQAYPLFAILWETLFLKRRKSALELLFTLTLITALFYLATGGTWRIAGLSPWFLLALCIPLLWSVAHVIVREVLVRTPITPAQVTFFRVAVSSLFLGVVLVAAVGSGAVVADLSNLAFQQAALVMGAVYYLELMFWFHAMRHIDVSVASSITVPAPALTLVLAILFLGEPATVHQVVTLVVVAASVYGLIWAGVRKERMKLKGAL